MKNLLLWIVSVLFNCSVYSATRHSDYFSTKVFCTSKLHLLKPGYYCSKELSKVCPIYNEYGDEYTKNTLYWSECLENNKQSIQIIQWKVSCNKCLSCCWSSTEICGTGMIIVVLFFLSFICNFFLYIFWIWSTRELSE